MRGIKTAVLCLLVVAYVGGAFAEAPIAVAGPRKARNRIVAVTRQYLGVPYLLGGTTVDGLDCSGLVWRVYHDSFGQAPLGAMPRTARDLFSFVEPLDKAKLEPGDLVFFNTTGALSHVGIYEGEGVFIHAASEGRTSGVIESSLGENYWQTRFAGAGRMIPPAGYLGLYLTASAGPSFGADDWFRGLDTSAMLSYRLGGMELGLEARPSWDSAREVFRMPLVMSFGIDRDLRFFFGPAVTMGTPHATIDGIDTELEAAGGWLACLGASWTAYRFRLGDTQAAVYLDVRYDHYVEASAGSGTASTLAPNLKVGVGLSMRWGF